MSTSVHWRLLWSNGLRLCRLQECSTTMRLWWASQGTRTYWRCALNRTNIRPMAREVTCRISVRRSTTVTAHLHLVWRALAIPAGVAAYHHLVGVALPSRAYCKRRAGPSRLPPPPRSHDPELQFDWSKFWEFLAPDLVLLVLAIAVSALYILICVQPSFWNISIRGLSVRPVSVLSSFHHTMSLIANLHCLDMRLHGLFPVCTRDRRLVQWS